MKAENDVHAVTFIGLGSMGWPIAANLVRAGYDVVGVDASPGRAESFARELSARSALTATDAAVGADVVVTMLPTSEHVASVVQELEAALAAPAVVVDMTSGVPGRSCEFARMLASRGVGFVDAAVSGGVARAQNGTISLMVGGAEELIQRLKPLFAAIGSATFRCGDVGSGHAMKSLNNLVSAGGLLVVAEALLIGTAAGLDPSVMVDVLNASSGMNNSTKTKVKQFILSGTYDSGFALDLMVKDLGIAVGIAADTDIDVPFSRHLLDEWKSAQAELGPGRRDHTEIARYSERIAGIELTASTAPRPAPPDEIDLESK